MDAEEYRKKIEFDILRIIEEKLQKGQMSADLGKSTKMPLSGAWLGLTYYE